ncbi:FAD-binding oxidoreductase [Acidovorax sp. ACV01]|uniref:FAD-binding oxidoreductase n=1 Tax=Acidovorax sp. ACV01 TaxID=2769311 RepID=UPI001780C50F|nr:FAD-binding oxidoreductase [Acidovorax sp. ACV01]MBD9394548.1 FAD-binding oxidoreductase [Acidovorax sp. ACV01]
MSALPQAVAEWRTLLGANCVLPAQSADALYGGGGALRIPAALRPTQAQSVQEIVRIASRHRISLYPVSTGRNWGYGGASPPSEHCVILDLSLLNRIIAVDAESGTVTIEPGVTQGQLRAHLDGLGLPFMVPTTGAGPSASLVGNALERGYGITPRADHFDAVMTIEAVLPDGRLYRPRLAALGGKRIGQGYKWGIGPYLDGLFSQSNFGVVTQMTIALAQRPPHVEAFYVFLNKEEQLQPALLALRGLLRTTGGVMGGVNILNGYRLASMTCPYPADVLARGTPLQADELAGLLQAHGLGAYVIIGSVYGEAPVARAAVAAIMRGFAHCSSRRVSLTRRKADILCRLASRFPRIASRLGLGPDHASRMLSALNLMEGIPDDVALRLPYWKSGAALPGDLPRALLSGERGLIWYSPLVPMTPEAVVAFQVMVTRVCLLHGFEPLITLTSLSDRCFDSSVPLLFDGRSAAQKERAHRCFDMLFDEGRQLGFVPYRMGSQFFHKLEAENDPALALARSLKQWLDPDNIISPGRYNL